MNILNKTILLSFFFLVIGSQIQAQEMAKTIYELYDLQKGDCGNIEAKVVGREWFTSLDDDSIESVVVEKKMPSLKKIKSALKVFRKSHKRRSNTFILDKKKLQNGNFCFLEKGKWGLMNIKGEVILRPQFDFVYLDTIADGFVGFQEEMCNYYDGNTGKKTFPEGYYNIKAEGKETFIIQSKNGYGLIYQGRYALEPIYEFLEKKESNGILYFLFETKEARLSILLNDYTTRIPVTGHPNFSFINENYILFRDNLYNIAKQKALICENNFSFRLIDDTEQLLAINKKGYRNEEYLIDFDGNIISNQSFVEIKKNENGLSVVMGVEKIKNKKDILKFGLIGKKGEWVVKLKVYKNMRREGKYYAVVGESLKWGLIDTSGKLILPMKYDFISNVAGNHFLCGFQKGKKINTKILALPSGAVIKDSLLYRSIRSSKLCNGNYLRAYLEGGKQQLINKNYEPITAVYDYVSFNENYLMGKTENQNKENQYELYTCEGERVYFEIKDEKIGIFDAVKELDDDLVYIYFDNKGYLIPANGQPISLDHYVDTYYDAKFNDYIILGSKRRKAMGMIDRRGKIILPFIFKEIKPIENETQLIEFTTVDDKKGLITIKGKLLTEQLYDELYYFGMGAYRVGSKVGKVEKWGVLGPSGKLILPIKYDYIYRRGGLLFVLKGKKYDTYNYAGKQLK